VKRIITNLAVRVLHGDESGQTLIEYSLVLALISLVAIAGLTAFSLSVENLYDTVMQASDAMIDSLS
jgi:Flp pilus assembly pilin Flp